MQHCTAGVWRGCHHINAQPYFCAPPPLPLPQVTASASFQKDLGLDSLDTVELVMALEEEFAIEIPDSEADKILSCGDAISYIASNPMAR